MIRGYPRQPSPRLGGTLTLHVATDAPRFRVELWRCGARLTHCATTDWFDGVDAPAHPAYQDFGQPGVGLHGEDLAAWPAYDVHIPQDWQPGVYVAYLVEGDRDGRATSEPDRTTPDARHGTALFVVRSPAPGRDARILYKLPLLTYHAYNLVDGVEYDPATGIGHWCLYNQDRLAGLRRERPGAGGGAIPASISVHRPGGGTGVWTYDARNWDPFDPTPRQTFVHWDWPFVRWLAERGYAVEFCTDVDLHREGVELLRPYRLLVSAGHDEYWSAAMRAGVEAFVDAGGNVAFFGGNTCWWRVEFDGETAYRRTAFWSDPASGDQPENALIGVSFRNGGERDRGEHPEPVGYRVQHADHWVYTSTGLRDGDVFGDARADSLLGFECDGAVFDRADLAAGRTVLPTGEDGTPKDFRILAIGDVTGWGFGNAAATMGLYTRDGGGTVFNAATTDWPRVLTRGTPRGRGAVERITRNVLDRLSGAPPPPAQLRRL